jgi:hypothetical protein
VRIKSWRWSRWLRTAAGCGFALGAWLAGLRAASAEVTLIEKDGWTFFTEGRVNTFFSQGIGDDFPKPSVNPNVGPNGEPGPTHQVTGSQGAFTAGYYSVQGDTAGKYSSARLRNGFLATILALGMHRRINEGTTIKSYISLWGTAQTYGRDRTLDVGRQQSKGFDVREGFMDVEGPWGGLVVGRQSGLFGHTATEIDFLYAHQYGLGLPCLDEFYASCGHIGTGVLGPGFASAGGLKLQAGVFDPVRLLGAWERAPYPRPEGILSYERRLSPDVMFKLSAEGMYQYIAQGGSPLHTTVWGAGGGGRLEWGPLRLGAAGFRGKGLGAYVALQNSPSSFHQESRELRTFTGYYAQTALVLGKGQLSAGFGRVIDDQLTHGLDPDGNQIPDDTHDPGNSNLKSQMGVSLGYYHALNDYLVVGADIFRFQTDWWGARASQFDDTGAVVLLPGVIKPEQQIIYFINVGATFHW